MMMTRVKELQRIQEAIENQNQTELQWALSYCQMRCKTAREVYSLRKKEKYWYQIEQKVRAAMEASTQAGWALAALCWCLSP